MVVATRQPLYRSGSNYAGRGFNPSQPGSVLRTDARLANPRVQGPYGGQSTTYDRRGNPTTNYNLSPEQQGIYNSQVGISGQANAGAATSLGQATQNYSQPYNYNGAPGMPSYNDPRQGVPGYQQFTDPRQGLSGMPSPQAINGQGYDAVMNLYNRRNQEQQGLDRSTLEQHLLNQGLQPGSEQYNQQMLQLSRQQSDANLDAQDRAIVTGNDISKTLFDQNFQNRQQGFNENFQTGGQQFQQGFAQQQQAFNQNYQSQGQYFDQGLQGRQQYINEYNQQRNAPLQEAQQLAGLGGLGARDPAFQPYQAPNTQNALAVDQFNRTPKGPFGGGGGGGGFAPQVDPLQQQLLMQQLQGYFPSNSPQGGGNPYASYLGGAAGAFLGPFAYGAGSYLGGS